MTYKILECNLFVTWGLSCIAFILSVLTRSYHVTLTQNRMPIVGFLAVTVMMIQAEVFWVVTPCSIAEAAGSQMTSSTWTCQQIRLLNDKGRIQESEWRRISEHGQCEEFYSPRSIITAQGLLLNQEQKHNNVWVHKWSKSLAELSNSTIFLLQASQ
jgi:hypothetical protein